MRNKNEMKSYQSLFLREYLKFKRGVCLLRCSYSHDGSVRKTNTFEYYSSSIFFEDDTEFLFTRFVSIKRAIKLIMSRLILPRRLQHGKKNCCENLTLNRRRVLHVVVVFRDAWRMRLRTRRRMTRTRIDMTKRKRRKLNDGHKIIDDFIQQVYEVPVPYFFNLKFDL